MDGVDYRFVTPQAFSQLVQRGAFLEWAEVFGRRYGTPLAPVRQALEAGMDAILELDVQGAASVRRAFPEAVLVFLMPPSDEELSRRLRGRRTEGRDARGQRLATAKQELRQASWFDHVVVNDEVDRAADEVLAIIDGRHAPS